MTIEFTCSIIRLKNGYTGTIFVTIIDPVKSLPGEFSFRRFNPNLYKDDGSVDCIQLEVYQDHEPVLYFRGFSIDDVSFEPYIPTPEQAFFTLQMLNLIDWAEEAAYEKHGTLILRRRYYYTETVYTHASDEIGAAAIDYKAFACLLQRAIPRAHYEIFRA